MMGEDTLCTYQPDGTGVIPIASEVAATAVTWTQAARARLDRVPPFVRRFVRQRAEAYVREKGWDTVTAQHLEILVRRRFGGAGPPATMMGGTLLEHGAMPGGDEP